MDILSSYDISYRQQMDTFEPGLWSRLERVLDLDPATRDAVLRYLLELACQAQNARNIVLGRAAILALPHDWLLANLEGYAEPLLQLEDEWEYRRLAELYEPLDDQLLRRLVVRGMASSDAGIREAAEDCQRWLDRSHWQPAAEEP
jgi:hypothetical protein